jgi:APA family basic amino acid/polyamine antiporter
MVNYKDIYINAPVAVAVRLYAPLALSIFIEVCDLAGVLLAALLAQPFIFQSMSNEGLFPAVFSKINTKTQLILKYIKKGMLHKKK